MRWIAFTLLIFATSPALAGEVIGLGGTVFDVSRNHGNFSWQLEYREELAEHFDASFTYLNEGHLPDHHRDGHGVQFWARSNLLDHRLSFAAGAGPYLYYDTSPSEIDDAEVNRHGVALISSLAATWRFDNRILLQLRVNGIAASNSFDTVSTLLGIGYALDTPRSGVNDAGQPLQELKTIKNEITLYLGQANVFNEGSSHSAALSVEYRRTLMRHLEWSVAFLYEGESDLIRRRGIATQLWAANSFLDDDLSLGVGVGPYLAIDSIGTENRGGRDLYCLPVVTMTAAYRFHPQWGARVSWDRVITDYDRDSDIWLGGVSYLF